MMREEYDFSKGVKNPYANNLKSKKVVTIRIEDETIDYFKGLAEEMKLPYQTLINLYLKDCVEQGRKLKMTW
ncbi:BrnA antitoxin family protein [Rodentibacter heidelbergensis]|nr:BrnA antitoxin family protein [Rodentibacter heidelbergensis]